MNFLKIRNLVFSLLVCTSLLSHASETETPSTAAPVSNSKLRSGISKETKLILGGMVAGGVLAGMVAVKCSGNSGDDTKKSSAGSSFFVTTAAFITAGAGLAGAVTYAFRSPLTRFLRMPGQLDAVEVEQRRQGQVQVEHGQVLGQVKQELGDQGIEQRRQGNVQVEHGQVLGNLEKGQGVLQKKVEEEGQANQTRHKEVREDLDGVKEQGKANNRLLEVLNRDVGGVARGVAEIRQEFQKYEQRIQAEFQKLREQETQDNDEILMQMAIANINAYEQEQARLARQRERRAAKEQLGLQRRKVKEDRERALVEKVENLEQNVATKKDVQKMGASVIQAVAAASNRGIRTTVRATSRVPQETVREAVKVLNNKSKKSSTVRSTVFDIVSIAASSNLKGRSRIHSPSRSRRSSTSSSSSSGSLGHPSIEDVPDDQPD